jgi:hypothetical protein
MAENSSNWFAVRCVFATGWPPEARGETYEERITLWQADSAEEAISRAEAEAEGYAAVILDSPDTYLGLAQSYHLFDGPGDGAEVFSLMRRSQLGADDYLLTFFATGTERTEDIK